MKKSKLFIILIITIAALTFTTAQICNQCGIAPSQETKIDVEDDTGVSIAEETSRQTQQTQGGPAAPTIELTISEGPLYSEADDVCYYRVEATVTGNPAPEITWSKDDSLGRLGNNIAQVNLTRDNSEYTLVGTAENSVDNATDEIVLSWGCDGEEVDGEEVAEEEAFEEEDEEVPTILGVDKFNSGYLVSDGSGESRGDILIGDNDENKAIRGFISFDIRSLPDSPIINAEFRISDITKIGDPTFEDELYIYNTYYGAFESGDYELESSFALTLIIPTADLTSINSSSGVLLSHLEARRSNGYDAFQIMLIFNQESDGNGDDDWFIISPDNVELEVNQ